MPEIRVRSRRRPSAAPAIAVLIASALASSATGQGAYFSLEGNFGAGLDRHDFLFDLGRDVAAAEAQALIFATYAGTGGTNAAGDTFAGGGINSVLELFDGGGASRGFSDDENGVDSLISWPANQTGGTPLNPDPLPADSYRLNLTDFAAAPGAWAVDLIGPDDAITFTGVTATGTSTITSLKFGTTGGTAVFNSGASLSIVGPLVVAQTGGAALNHSAGTLAVSGAAAVKAGGAINVTGGTFDAGGILDLDGGTLDVAAGGTARAITLNLGASGTVSTAGTAGNAGVLRADSLFLGGGIFNGQTFSVLEVNALIGLTALNHGGSVALGAAAAGPSASALTVNSGQTLAVGEALSIGETRAAALTIAGSGTVTATGGAAIGATAAAVGSGVTVTASGLLDVGGDLRVGGSAGGVGGASTLTVDGGFGTRVRVGGTLEVLAGSTLALDGGVLVADTVQDSGGAYTGGIFGELRTNRLLGFGGAISFSHGLVLGAGDGVNTTPADFTFTGAGTTVTALYTDVGNVADASMTVSDGAVVTASSTFSLVGGAGGTSGGTVVVTGAGSRWSLASDLRLHHGSLTIADGGSVSNNNAFIGRDSGAVGMATVDGAASTWTNNRDLSLGRSSNSGAGTLNIINGGTVHIGDAAAAGGAAGELTVSDSNSDGNSGGNLNVYNGGTLSHGGTAVLGRTAGEFGWSLVEDPGSTWTNAGDLTVGLDGGGGTLVVNAGGVVSNAAGWIVRGGGNPSVGSVTVDDPGSTWTSAGELTVGDDGGSGTLLIDNGGGVTSGAGWIARGGGSGSTGTVTVDESGSSWALTGDLTVGDDGGDGTLSIEDGAAVSNAAAWIARGGGSGGIGAVTVTGAGSTWTSTGDLSVGLAADATLTVSAGGSVTNADAGIAAGGGSTGAAVVTGAGSTWASSGGLAVGGDAVAAGGTGTLSVTSGGGLTVGGELKIWGAGAVDVDGASLTADSIANHDGGTLTFTSGTLTVTTGGLAVGPGGQLPVTNLLLDGTKHVNVGGRLTLLPGVVLTKTAASTLTTGPVQAVGASSIILSSGDQVLGDASAPDGFYGNGDVSIAGGSTLTLDDANDAVLDSGALVTLGGAGAATLAAANGITLDFGANVTGFGTVVTPDDPFTPLINNGNIAGSSPAEPITLTGYVKGAGTLTDVVITGTDAPGFSPAAVYRGSVTYAGALEIEIGGTAPGSGHDQVNHSGAAALGGALDVSLINGFAPDAGDTFTILTALGGVGGAFTAEALPALGGILDWDVQVSANDVTLAVIAQLLPGDANNDGAVSAADLLAAQQNFGNVGPNGDGTDLGDANDDGVVTVDDLITVQQNFGNLLVSVGGSAPRTGSGSSAVPEPASLTLLLAGSLMRRRGGGRPL